MTELSTAHSETRTVPVGELVFAGGVVALGVFALVRAHTINQPLAASGMGPRAVPYLIGVALLASGGAVLIGVLRGRLGEAESGEDVAEGGHTDWATVALLVALFVVHIFLIVPAGWPIAAAVLFTGCAWTFGAKPRWRAAMIGVALALVLQLVFGGGLGVSLPPGPLLEGVSFLHG